MAIIINEIEISVEVGNGAAGAADPLNAERLDKEEIIRVCVEKVMEILNQKSER